MGNSCCGVSNAETLRRIEAVVGSDGYHDWENMPKPLSFRDMGLPALGQSQRNESAAGLVSAAVAVILAAFDDNGNQPFAQDVVDRVLNRCLFARSKALMEALDFGPTGKYTYSTVRAFVEEMATEVLKNDIIVAALAIAHVEGVSIFQRQGNDVETTWIVESVAWCYALHVITMTAEADKSILKLLYEHVQEMRTGPLAGWQEEATDFEYLKTSTIDPAVASMFKASSNVPSENKLDATANLGLTMNIMEAMWSDYQAGNKDNAEAGYELAVLDGLFDFTRQANRARHATAESSMFKISPIPRNYSDLYHSWNLNFVCQEYPGKTPVVLAKLLTPAVGSYSARPERYMQPRVIALYAQILREMCERVIDGTNGDLPEVDTWISIEFRDLWSKVNLIYSKRYRAFYESLGRGLAGIIRTSMDAASDIFVQSVWKEVKEAIEDGEPERLTKAITSMLSLLAKLKIIDIDLEGLKTKQELNGERREQLAQSIEQSYMAYA